MGAKGCGKTYGILKWCLNDYLKNGENHRFIYLRRYDTELEDLDELFESLRDEFEDYIIKVRGKFFYIAPKDEVLNDDGEIRKGSGLYTEKYKCGRAIPLSSTSKSKSKDFIHYDKVIFEEFLISQAHVYYIKNELNIFLEMIDGIFRHRPVKVFFFGNNMTTINPYFTYFGIKNPKKKGITKYKLGNKKMILVWYYDNPLFIKYKMSTDIGAIEMASEFGKYAIGNEVLYDNKAFIEKKTKESQFKFSLIYNKKIIGFWLDVIQGKLYASFKYPKDWTNHYASTTEDMEPNVYFFRRMKNNYHMKLLQDSFTYSYLYYENIQVKEICSEIMKMFNYF